MSDEKTPAQPGSKSQTASQISQVFGPIKLLPGESEAVFRAGLVGTIGEFGAATQLQINLAEKYSSACGGCVVMKYKSRQPLSIRWLIC
jgi:hypothetical protein